MRLSTDHTTEKDEASSREELQIGEKAPANVSKENLAVDTLETGDVVTDEPEPEYPEGFRLALIIMALILSIFLVALDMSIVATAIPRITDDFKSLDHVGWYGSVFFVTLAAFQSTWGGLYKYFSLKPVFITASAVFEIGSLLCGVSPNSEVLIIGRAIQGCGSAGLVSGAYMIIAYVARPERRPAYTGILGAVFGISSVAGPLLGGIFTDEITWRWCFYINLPIGGLAILVILFYYKTPAHVKPPAATLWEKIQQMDIIGTVLVTVALVCYLLAMQWGGISKTWASAPVISTLVVSVVLAAAFVALELYQNERSLLVPRLLKQRTTAASCVFIFFLNGANFLFVYYIPIYFQSIHGLSASQSGIRNLPLIVTNSMVSAFLGASIGVVGYYKPFMVASGVISAIGCGLLYTLDMHSSEAQYLGYQALLGVGLGLGVQVPMIAMQALSEPADMATNTAIILFFQLIGGGIFISAAESIFANRLLQVLRHHAPGVHPAEVLDTGIFQMTGEFSSEDLHGILSSYMVGLKGAWALGVALAVAAAVASWGPENRYIKVNKKQQE